MLKFRVIACMLSMKHFKSYKYDLPTNRLCNEPVIQYHKKYRKNGNGMHAIVFVKYTSFPDTRSEQMLPATLAYIMLI